MNLDEVCGCGDTRDLDCAVVPGGSQVKGAGPLEMSGATLKIPTCLGLEKTSCGVEPRKRASLQGFESPSPHHLIIFR
jgi:hypothetical protein